MDYTANTDFKQIYDMSSKKLQSKATGIGNYNGNYSILIIYYQINIKRYLFFIYFNF